MRIIVDRDECTGCGNCVDIAPDVFELDDEGISTVTNPEGADLETIREAADSCPLDCITIEED